MDTLSRKHRIKQQQQQQVPRSHLYYEEENTFRNGNCYSQGRERRIASIEPPSRQAKFGNTVVDDDYIDAYDDDEGGEERIEEFNVFKVVEVNNRHSNYEKAGRHNNNNGNQQIRILSTSSNSQRSHQIKGEAGFKSSSRSSNSSLARQIRKRRDETNDDDDDDDVIVADYDENNQQLHVVYNNCKSTRKDPRPIQCPSEATFKRSSKRETTTSIQSNNTSIGGGSSSGFSSAPGSYSSSSQIYADNNCTPPSQQQYQVKLSNQARRNKSKVIDCQRRRDGISSGSHNNNDDNNHRGKLIDDLDRLLKPTRSNDERLRSNAISPTDSYLSNNSTFTMDKDKRNLLQANDFGYSTLCRDEFSSFIPAKRKQQQHQSAIDASNRSVGDNPGGPMLVGIHDMLDTARMQQDEDEIYADEDVDDYNDEDEQEEPYEREFNINNNNNNNNIGKHKNIYDQRIDPTDRESIPTSSDRFSSTTPLTSSQSSFACSPSAEFANSSPEAIQSFGNTYKEVVSVPAAAAAAAASRPNDQLTKMLDVYLDRLNSLIRLTHNDKSVTIDEAFKYDDCSLLEISPENSTPIAIVPIEKPENNNIQVIQEVEFDDLESRRLRVTTCVSQCEAKLNSILESIQTSPELDWSYQIKLNESDYYSFELNDCKSSVNDLVKHNCNRTNEEDLKHLEESLISRLIDFSREIRATDNLVRIIRIHLREFIENYRTYQKELRARTEFAHGSWHENWLFASKRPRDCSIEQTDKLSINYGADLKRAKLTSGSWISESPLGLSQRFSAMNGGQYKGDADLIKYSTMILAKYKPIRLTLVHNSDDGNKEDYGDHHEKQPNQLQIESYYEAQQELLNELELVAIESSRQTDVCRMLLLCDTDDCDDTMDFNNNKGRRRQERLPVVTNGYKRSLLVSYESTSLTAATRACCNANKFFFTASGYLFQSSLIKFPICDSGQGPKLARIILDQFLAMITKQQQQQQQHQMRVHSSERAHFVISLSNIELINKLPVIQFCAKISGSLPMRVRWFRQEKKQINNDDHDHSYEELSDISIGVKRKKLNIRSMIDHYSDWPIELQASYDYEYQSDSSSWFRFRRNKDEILFEIREPSLQEDYNRAYKCVIDNYCSIGECKFTLTRRDSMDGSQISRPRLQLHGTNQGHTAKHRKTVIKSRKQQEQALEQDGHALLRTWSQRTLNKPQPSEQRLSEQEQQVENNSFQLASRQQTVGRLSASKVDKEKFGENFPYHPKNLLKRLEENKFSISATTKRLQTPTSSMNDCYVTASEKTETSHGDKDAGSCSYSEFNTLSSVEIVGGSSHDQHLPTNDSAHYHMDFASEKDRGFIMQPSKDDPKPSCGQSKLASCNFQLERPRAVINMKTEGDLDQLDKLNASQDTNADNILKKTRAKIIPITSINHEQQTPNQQPVPRLRLSQTSTSTDNKVEQEPSLRLIAHESQLIICSTDRGTPKPASEDQRQRAAEIVDHESRKQQGLKQSTNSFITCDQDQENLDPIVVGLQKRKLNPNQDNKRSTRSEDSLKPPTTSTTNVKSLISRFSVA